MEFHDHCLNIHYSLPAETWGKIAKLYEDMPHWNGFKNGIPQWYGQEYGDKLIEASVEPGGLQLSARLPQEEWEHWFKLFKSKASELLGYKIGEPQDGFNSPDNKF